MTKITGKNNQNKTNNKPATKIKNSAIIPIIIKIVLITIPIPLEIALKVKVSIYFLKSKLLG